MALRRTQRLNYAQIQPRASHKSRVPKERGKGGDADADAGLTSRSRSRNKDSPASKTDPGACPRRKGNAARQARLMERAPMENRSGRIVDTVLTRAESKAERKAGKAMTDKLVQANADARSAPGADRSDEAPDPARIRLAQARRGLELQSSRPHTPSATKRC